MAEEEVVAGRELEEDLAGEDIARGGARGGQEAPMSHRAVVSAAPSIQAAAGRTKRSGDSGSAACNGREGSGRTSREPGYELGPHAAHQVRAQQGQDDAGGLFRGFVLAAFLGRGIRNGSLGIGITSPPGTGW